MRVAIALLLIATSTLVASQSLGDRLSRGYTVYDQLPITTSQTGQLGWSIQNNGSCVNGLGIPYSMVGPKGPSRSKPMTLYYTPAGQVASISMVVFGKPKAPDGYWRLIGKPSYHFIA
jgi:hypothetical protein